MRTLSDKNQVTPTRPDAGRRSKGITQKVYNDYLEDSEAKMLIQKCLELEQKYGALVSNVKQSASERIMQGGLNPVCFEMLS